MKETIAKYIDFRKLGKPERKDLQVKDINNINQVGNVRNEIGNENDTDKSNNNSMPRLILTATNVQTGEPVIFDSNNTDITANHIIASAGYAVYGLPWIRLDDKYFWDGSFVHNTPLKAVTKVSKAKKIVYVSDVFPSKQKKLPTSMPETYQRVTDTIGKVIGRLKVR